MRTSGIPWTQAVWRDAKAVAAWSEDVLEAIGPLVDDPDALPVVLAAIGRLHGTPPLPSRPVLRPPHDRPRRRNVPQPPARRPLGLRP